MKILEIARKRYSCRSYKPTPIDDLIIEQIMDTVRVAPSAVNFQPWHFIIVRSAENKEKVIQSYPREWIRQAPVLVIACGDHSVSWKRSDGKDYLDIDIAIAIDHMVFQATELGLGTCWVCNFNADILKKNLLLPDRIEPVAIIPLGYPVSEGNSDRHDTTRKTIREFIHWEKF